MRRLKIDKEMSVAVAGLGTIGLLVTMFLLGSGVKNIYLIGNKDSQKDACVRLGIKEENFINSKEKDTLVFINEKTGEKGLDVFFECVGKNETLDFAMDLIGADGQIMLVGNPYSDMKLDKNRYWKILRKQLTIKGTWNSSFLGEEDTESLNDDWHFVIRKLLDGNFNPEKLITHRFSLKDLDKGIDIMKNKTESYTKIMIVNEK